MVVSNSIVAVSIHQSINVLNKIDIEWVYSSSILRVVEDRSPRQLGNITGRGKGWLLLTPSIALAKVYPNAVDTENATAFPTCMYLKNET